MKHIKQILLLVSSTVLLAFASLAANADNHAKDRAYIKDAMHKMDVATQNKDLNGYLVFLHPDYTNVNAAGITTAHNKAEMRAQMSRMFARAISITIRPTAVKAFTFDKQGATVYESGNLSMILMVSGQKSVIQGGGTYRDFWIKTTTGWQEKSSSSVSSKITLDGKPIQ